MPFCFLITWFEVRILLLESSRARSSAGNVFRYYPVYRSTCSTSCSVYSIDDPICRYVIYYQIPENIWLLIKWSMELWSSGLLNFDRIKIFFEDGCSKTVKLRESHYRGIRGTIIHAFWTFRNRFQSNNLHRHVILAVKTLLACQFLVWNYKCVTFVSQCQ